MTVCGLNPAGFLVMMGLANIATEVSLPFAHADRADEGAGSGCYCPALVPLNGLCFGFRHGDDLDIIRRHRNCRMAWPRNPQSVIRGIQASLGILLIIEAVKMLSSGWVLGILSVIALALRQNRHAPAAVVLMGLGIVIVLAKGQLFEISTPSLSLPPITAFRPEEIWQTLVLAGFAQIPLTVTNATIATSSLISTYWPDRPVSEKRLSLNQGLMNLVVPFFGGMPMCHGAGGLARAVLLRRQNGRHQYHRRACGNRPRLVLRGVHCRTVHRLSPCNHWGHDVARRRRDDDFAKIRSARPIDPHGGNHCGILITNMAYGFLAKNVTDIFVRVCREKAEAVAIISVASPEKPPPL
jgi:hypothetical protein